MKKILTAALIALMIMSLLVPMAAFAGADPGQNMWVNCRNGKSLNLRQSPSTGSGLIARLPCGTKVTVLEDAGNGWAKISAPHHTGYVMTKFLVASKPGKYEITEQANTFSPVSPYMATAIAVKGHEDRSVGLRTMPNKDSKAFRHLAPGDEVQVIAQGKLWSEVIDPQTGRTGYVASSYLQRT